MVYPICCVVDVSGEFLTRLIKANLEESRCTNLEDFCLTVVDSIEKTYTRPVALPVPSTSPESPFKGKTTEQCLTLLREVSEHNEEQGIQAPDGIETGLFIILDDRSLNDDTGLLVAVQEGELELVRIGLRSAETLALCVGVGHGPTMKDLQEEAAKSADGIALGKNPRKA